MAKWQCGNVATDKSASGQASTDTGLYGVKFEVAENRPLSCRKSGLIDGQNLVVRKNGRNFAARRLFNS